MANEWNSNGQLFTRKVMNRDGCVLALPNVAEMSELYQSYPLDVHGESATPLFPLGTMMRRGEQVFVYCKNGGGALAAGVPLQGAIAVHAEQDDDIVVGAAAAIGATEVEITSTANLDGSPNDEADNFAEGYLVVNDLAGEGHLYKIKSNEALAGTADSTFTLYDPIKVALTTASQVGLIRNPFAGVIATAAVATRHFVGTAPAAITVAYYFWAHHKGPAPAVAANAIALGTYVVVGTTAASVDPGAAATTELIIGYPITPGITAGETCIVYLT